MAAISTTNPLLELAKCGQSVWMDNFRRGWILSGELERIIREDGIKGVTVNPTIFEKAVSGSSDYDDAIHELVDQGKTTAQIYEELMIQDIRMAADLFKSVYDESHGVDGFVSIELPPDIAYDTKATIREAHRYHDLVGRENIMIKVPGTAQGVPAIEELTFDGLNINVTLLFSIDRYEEVARAYIRGLHRRLENGKLIDRISSVASFFVSRIDVAVDRELDTLRQSAGDTKRREIDALREKAAIANAKLAYQKFKEVFGEQQYKDLELRGAKPQRVLWASTSTKTPGYPDVYYVQELIGPQTVDTMPTQTLFAFKDHGKVAMSLESGIPEAQEVLHKIQKLGIDFNSVTSKLEEDGIKSFQKSVDDLMTRLQAKHENLDRLHNSGQTQRLGDYSGRIEYTLGAFSEQGFSRRLWEKDPSLWKQGTEGEKVIKNRLGWLDVVETMLHRTDEITRFVDNIRNDGFTHVVLMGMGGSSLSPEVSCRTFGVKQGYPRMMVLDSTVPAAVSEIDSAIDPAKTIFIVATKSGGTIETLSAYKHFYSAVQKIKGDSAGENFVAITDPDTSLVREAEDKEFRKVFINFPDIGGRYSALSYFGIVPAAIIGVDIDLLLHRAWQMCESSSACISPSESPSMVLGTIIGEMTLEGRNKLTLITSPDIESFGLWVEQLVAESTGKSGQGVIPVVGEPVQPPNRYGDDRFFVYMKSRNSDNAELDAKVGAIESAGFPVVRILLDDIYDLGQEYYRWEIATSVACAILGVNAFDEPNVKESKDNTSRLIDEFTSNGTLPSEEPVLEESGIKLFCDSETKSTLDKIRAIGPYADDSLLSYIAAFLHEFQPGNYFALMAFVHPDKQVEDTFSCIRAHLADAYFAATTLGFGPRFLHSTGQLHKGGPNTGIFLQFTADDASDVAIPEVPYSFSILKQAQAMGDSISLRSKGRPFIRLHLSANTSQDLSRVLDLIHQTTQEQETT